VLFFVSVGMLFDYRILFENPLPVLAVVAIIVLGKSAAAYLIVRAFKRSHKTALTIAASLAQIGEFSFILAGLGVGLKLLPEEGRDLILAGAILSIVINPFIFALIIPKEDPRKPKKAVVVEEPATDLVPTALAGHTVIVGMGRVGLAVAQGLKALDQPFVVIEDRPDTAVIGRAKGYEVIDGTGMDERVLAAAGVDRAKRLLVAIPDCFEAGEIIERSRKTNRALEIIARAHSDSELEHLAAVGADETVMGEREIARRMLERAEVATPEPVVAPAAPVETFEPAAPSRPILDDAEAALMGGLAQRGLLPGEAVSHRTLRVDPEIELFDDRRLDQAIATLAEKGLVTDLGDGRIALTRDGALWAK